jgi:hypothetical protein
MREVFLAQYKMAETPLVEPCPHCNCELDDGDIYTKLRHNKYYTDKTDVEVKLSATYYGWTTNNGKRFTKKIVVQPLDGIQYLICPECKHRL